MTAANIDARRLKKRAETALIDRLIAQESLGPVAATGGQP